MTTQILSAQQLDRTPLFFLSNTENLLSQGRLSSEAP